MKRLLLLILLIAGVTPGAVEAAELKPLMTTPGALLIEIDPAKNLAGWHIHTGKWQIVDGNVSGQELAEQKHGAVMIHPIDARDLVISYELKFGPKNRNATLALNSPQKHLCRLVFQPDRIALRKPDQDRNLGPDTQLTVDEKVMPLAADRWYSVMIETLGRNVLVNVDGKVYLYGGHEVYETTKKAVQLTAGGGDEVFYKNVRVWAAMPNDEWPANRSKILPALGKK